MNDIESILRSAVRLSGVRFAEVRWERAERTRIEMKSRTLDALATSVDEGGIVRVLATGGGFGIATVSSPARIAEALEEALGAARAAAAGEQVPFAAADPVEEARTVVLEEDFRRVPLAEKREVLERLEDVLLGTAGRVTDSRVVYRDELREVAYANSDGTWIRDERPLVDLYLEAIATAGGEVQSASEGLGRTAGFECVRGQEDLARAAARRAAETLDARPLRGGLYTVITDPALTGVFIHEALGHLCEADHIDRNPRLAELMRLGRVVGPPFLHVTDYADPVAPGLMGNLRHDDEGIAGGRTELIRGGVLVGRLHSRETAARFGARPTGNARAQDFEHEPLVRMTKTVVERGTTPVADLFAGVERGIYARGSRGGQTELGRFAFAAEEAFLVRDGKLAERLRDVALTGNVFETLANVSAIGDDFLLVSRGRCGKLGQSMPVSEGGPHVRMERVVVGGAGA